MSIMNVLKKYFLMGLSDISLRLEDLNSVSWDKEIERCSRKECRLYSSLFFDLAKEAQDASDIAPDVYRFLGHVTSPMLKSENDKEPFQPSCILGSSRSSIPSDFSEQQLELLKSFSPGVIDSELRARMTDLLWVTKKDFKMAQLAVDAYLESAERLEDPNKWSLTFKRVQRATCIASQLGKNNDYLPKVVAYVECLVEKYKAQDPLYLSTELIAHGSLKNIGE